MEKATKKKTTKKIKPQRKQLKATPNKKWFVIDAQGQILGRLATQIAVILRGKDNPSFVPNMDCGANVIIINAKKIKVTGKKLKDKKYYRHSGYLGGLKEQSLEELLAKKPTEVIRKAVWGMIPHNRLGRRVITNLKIYAGSDHPHQGVKPEELIIKTR